MKLNTSNYQFKTEHFVFLLPVFFVLNGAAQHFPLISLRDALILVTVYILAALILLVIFVFAFKSMNKAALFTFFLLCCQFFFGFFTDSLKKLSGAAFISKYSFVLTLTLTGILVVFLFLRKTNRTFNKFVRYLNLTLILLIVVAIFQLGIQIRNHHPGTEPKIFSPCVSCKKPNIYLIVVDEYAGKQALEDLFSFDNSLFERELEKRNFFVARAPKSNYNFTPYSMASIFDMNYLYGITNKSNDLKNQNICFQTINNNELVKTLRKMEYQFINLSLFDFAGEPNITDHNNFYSSRTKLLTNQTFTGRLQKELSFHIAYTLKSQRAFENYLNKLRENLNYQYKTTIEESRRSGPPRFTYTHFIMPHYPYLYNEYGTPLPPQAALYGSRKEYLGFLQYANEKSLSLIDQIKQYDRSDPIIILTSDHGFTKYDLSQTDSSYHFNNIFNIYMPGHNYSSFPDSISSVNIFRALFNSQFKQKLPLLKDSSFFLAEY